jgi:uncharacterized protein
MFELLSQHLITVFLFKISMKKYFKILAVIAAIIAGYLIVLQLYPKNAGRYPFLLLLLAGDYYFWRSFKDWVNNKKPVIKYPLTLLYWLPFLLLTGTSIFTFYVPAQQWDQELRIYLFGFIFIAYAAKILPILFLLLTDFFRGIQFINKKTLSIAKSEAGKNDTRKITRSQFLKNAGLISGGIMFSGLFIGMLKWVFDFKIHRHTIALPHLPLSFNGLKIIQISDIHLGSWAGKSSLLEAVNRINALKPDLIFFTGDLVNYKTDEAFPFENILAGLKAGTGIYATLGNHDYGDYTRWPSEKDKRQNLMDLLDFYQRLGWKLLNNENRMIARDGGKLAVVGVENWGDFGRFPKYGDLDKALIGAEDANIKLLLSHDPSHWDKIVTKQNPDIDLTFSGHTHGFQFGIEIKNIKWSPAKYVYKHWAGMYTKTAANGNLQRLYVNRGLGTIGYPGRVGILPEITLFELVQA